MITQTILVATILVTVHDLFLNTYFYSASARDIDIAILSVRPSIPVSDENGLTYCHSFFTVR